MTHAEIRCTKHLVETAQMFGPVILRDYDTFKRALEDEHKHFDLDERRFEYCLKAAYVELKSG